MTTRACQKAMSRLIRAADDVQRQLIAMPEVSTDEHGYEVPVAKEFRRAIAYAKKFGDAE